jgi:hypothetical protein
MTWRDHSWEFFVVGLSWLVAIGALGFIALFLVAEALRERRQRKRSP